MKRRFEASKSMVSFVLVMVLLTMGCGEKVENPAEVDTTENSEQQTEAKAFYTDTVKTVLDQRCVSCHKGSHSEDGNAPFNSFDAFKSRVTPVKNRVGTIEDMPPPGTSQFSAFTEAEKQQILRLVEMLQKAE